jgi:hypothetical protein
MNCAPHCEPERFDRGVHLWTSRLESEVITQLVQNPAPFPDRAFGRWIPRSSRGRREERLGAKRSNQFFR